MKVAVAIVLGMFICGCTAKTAGVKTEAINAVGLAPEAVRVAASQPAIVHISDIPQITINLSASSLAVVISCVACVGIGIVLGLIFSRRFRDGKSD